MDVTATQIGARPEAMLAVALAAAAAAAGGCFPVAAQRLPQDVARRSRKPDAGSRPTTSRSTTRRAGKSRPGGSSRASRAASRTCGAPPTSTTRWRSRRSSRSCPSWPSTTRSYYSHRRVRDAGGRPDLRHARRLHAGVRPAARPGRHRLSRDHALRPLPADSRLRLVLERVRRRLHAAERLDPWFDEGLAVYYETKLQPGTGRLAWPFWRGAFAAGFAGRRIGGGDLRFSSAIITRAATTSSAASSCASWPSVTARTSCGS